MLTPICLLDSFKRGTKDTKGIVKLINPKQTDNAMAKNEKDKQTTAHTTQHRNPKNKQHESHQKTRGYLRCSGRISRSCSTCGKVRNMTNVFHPFCWSIKSTFELWVFWICTFSKSIGVRYCWYTFSLLNVIMIRMIIITIIIMIFTQKLEWKYIDNPFSRVHLFVVRNTILLTL